ncbi:MAG: hypothetical protein IPJ71_05880 [Bdellovibrionales bacterium]|nr:hypothetical protein [Bdellovibrionales bacterium]
MDYKEPKSNKNVSLEFPNNGGGFAGGGGGGGSAMPYSGGGGGYGGPGYDTDVLKGVSGGGGYTSSPLGAESREGYSSFSGVLENGKRSENPFDKFDLKQYLPGGKNTVTLREILRQQMNGRETLKSAELTKISLKKSAAATGSCAFKNV